MLRRGLDAALTPPRHGTEAAAPTPRPELFELAFDPDGRLAIVWRGPGPPSGMAYASSLDGGVAELVCSDCHAADWMNDSVLNPFTRLSY